MRMDFAAHRGELEKQFRDIQWLPDSGLSPEDLEAAVLRLEAEAAPRAIVKAETFALIAQKARIAVDRYDIFQDKLEGSGIMRRQRARWEKKILDRWMPEEARETAVAWTELGAYRGNSDYGHISPNSRLLLQVGLPGLLDRVEQASRREGLSQKQKDFYSSCIIVLNAMCTVAKRLSNAIKPHNPNCAAALWQLAEGAPRNSYEAMQLLVLYFFLHEYVAGARVRTLGRLDVLLYPFYQRDLKNGTFTKDEIREMLRFFLHKFWSAKVPFDLPLCLGGMDADGAEVTNEMSYLIVEIYNALDIYSPKIHIRVSERTPEAFVKLVLSCIRGGNSSFVFVNDTVAVRSLQAVGIESGDAWDYVPIGCYEPAVWGVEIGCTGNGGINLPKALELVFTNGTDLRTGKKCGIETGNIDSYEAFVAALKAQIAYMTGRATGYVTKIEKHYGEIYPDPILSSQYDCSVETGVDVYEGGAKYNNSSMYFYSIASLADSVCAVKKLVFEEGKFTFEQLGEILRNNWAGYEKDRARVLRFAEKYGNDHPAADAVAVEFAHFCADLVNNKPNGRGGVFKAALFTIDNCFKVGKLTMATPDGRLAGQPLSKNLCAVTAMDKNGITALIRSVTKMDLSRFPNGSVLDVVLHPSAVSGEDGLSAFYGILLTYFKMGGFAMHGNVFHAEDLKKAQQDPETYKNLQVRVCGWNAYFVNLSREEQDAFIRQAENNC